MARFRFEVKLSRSLRGPGVARSYLEPHVTEASSRAPEGTAIESFAATSGGAEPATSAFLVQAAALTS